jgi:putative ABC transport system permease protein
VNLVADVLGDSFVTALPLVPAFMGIYLVFVMRNDFDLTVEGSFTLGGAITAVLLTHRMPVAMAMATAVLFAGMAGVCTTLLHIYLRIPVILAGLLMATGLYSVNLRIMSEPTLSLLGYPTLFSRFLSLPLLQNDAVVSLVVATILVFVLAAVAFFLLTDIGLAVRSAGVNPGFARSQGVNTRLSTGIALGGANMLVGLSGALAVQQQGFADVDMGTGILLAGIGAVLVGQLLVRPSGSQIIRAMAAVTTGTIVYRMILAIALRVGLQASDLNAVTATILVCCFTLQRSMGSAWEHRSKKAFRQRTALRERKPETAD